MKKLIIITGQTATGKTKLALEYAAKYDGELINCDSRQIYKHLDIVTGKDLTSHDFHKTKTIQNFDVGYYDLAGFPIWLYDIVNPKETFSSFDYTTLAKDVIQDIHNRNKTAIIVGGTYFYLKHLLYDFDIKSEPNWELRKELEDKSISQLQEMLKNLDADLFESLNNSDRNNPHRLIRKIEIVRSDKVSFLHNQETKPKKFSSFGDDTHIEFIGLKHESKEKLETAITKRVEERIASGAYQEVEKLLTKNYSENDPGLKTIGYPQIIQFLKKEINEESLLEQWKTKELQYAKRQFTFMKQDPNISWNLCP